MTTATTPLQRAQQRTLALRATNRAHKATPMGGDEFIVESGRSGNHYQVTLKGKSGRCTCKAGQVRMLCDHIIAALTERARRTINKPALRTMAELEADLDGHHVAKLRRLVDEAINAGHASDAGHFARSLVKATRGTW